ncbi:hypothetical protein F4779DRAFT_365037 [Xylariaceae sp. FL0662B]|nr:hypothetical protein F4779DRAFT_365037 [Xylariaceae sp. FL0662B]
MAQEQIYELEATAIFFGCGHRFVQFTDDTPALNKELQDHLFCPICHSQKCLSCGANFAGWVNSCEKCRRFVIFEAEADVAIAKDMKKMSFKHGIIMVPSVDDDETRIKKWVSCLSSALGFAVIEAEVGDGGSIVAADDMQLQLSHITQLDDRGLIESGDLLKPLKMDMKIVDFGITY